MADSITALLQEVLNFMQQNGYCLPKIHTNPMPEQQAETALRRKYDQSTKRSAAFNEEQHLLLKEINFRRTNAQDMQSLDELKKWAASHGGGLPAQARNDATQRSLAMKLKRLEGKASKEPMLGAQLAELKSNVHNSPTKPAARGAKQKAKCRAADDLFQRLREEHEEWCGLHFPSQERSKRQPEPQEKYPYPGLVNLGNTCYLNAVCQVLFHCVAARKFLRSGVEMPEASPADVADDDSATLLQELQSLAQNLADGFPTELPGQRCHVDCWSPHYLLDVFLRCRPLQLGGQHDAREALEEILTCTRLGKELFDTGAERVQRSDIVSLPAFAEDGWCYQSFTSNHQVVQMRELLADAFSHLNEKLLMPPSLLALVIPPFAFDDESDTTIWLNGTTREQLLRADWGNYKLDLTTHFSHCSGGEQAVYKLTGYIAYEGDEDVTPNWTLIDGHFIAYFREEDNWYKADDSIVTPTRRPPAAFPYICIFERVDLDLSLPWPPSLCSSDEADSDEDEDEDEEEETDEDMEEEEDQEDELRGVQIEDEPAEASRQEVKARRKKIVLCEPAHLKARLAYESLCIPWPDCPYGGLEAVSSGLPVTLSPQKILAAKDLETIIKLTCVEGETGTMRTCPSSELPWSLPPRYYHGRHFPEAFFQDEFHDLTNFFGNMRDTVDAMRRILRFLPRGDGLKRATRAYFSLQWKQTTPFGLLLRRVDSKPEHFVVDRRDTRRDAGRLDAFHCFETLFFRMCETAMQLGRGKEIEEALPRPRLLVEAIVLSGGCVEGLKQVAVKLDDHDYKTTVAHFQTLMTSLTSPKNCLRVCTQKLAMERLDDWREWSLTEKDERACKKRKRL